MSITELIRQLEDLRARYGDLPVHIYDRGLRDPDPGAVTSGESGAPLSQPYVALNQWDAP